METGIFSQVPVQYSTKSRAGNRTQTKEICDLVILVIPQEKNKNFPANELFFFYHLLILFIWKITHLYICIMYVCMYVVKNI